MSTPPGAIDEALQRLVDPPPDQSASRTLLAEIAEGAKTLPTVAEHETYTKYINQAWDEKQDLDFAKERQSLVADVGIFNDLLRNQIELSQNAQALDDELKSAWSAAETNAKIARDVCEKANTLQESVQGLQERVHVLEQEKSIKDLLRSQHQEMLLEVRSQARSIVAMPEISNLPTAVSNLLAPTMNSILPAISDLSANMQGSRNTTDQTAQSVNPSANTQGIRSTIDPTVQDVSDVSNTVETNPNKRRLTQDLSAPAELHSGGEHRRNSLQSPRGRGALQGGPQRGLSTPGRSNTRSSQKASQSTSTVIPSLAETSNQTDTPETTLGQPPSGLPPVEVPDHTQVDDVYSIILAWDGKDLFDISEIPASLTDAIKKRISNEICKIDADKFKGAVTSSINKHSTACLWQRVSTRPRNADILVGYHACPECVANNVPCIIRSHENRKLPATRPYLAPLPDNIRPITATRRDLEYWIKP
jgi:uncharacterized protein YoxC